MNTMQQNFDTLIQEHRALKQRFQTDAQTLFKKITQEFFVSNPGVTAFVWTQYLPSFNDGDPCTFTVGEIVFTNAPAQELANVSSYGEYEGEDDNVQVFGSWYLKNHPIAGVNLEQVELIESFVNNSDMESVLEEMFGCNVRITATAAGFDVEDYDCGY
jgi:hypothetical protein